MCVGGIADCDRVCTAAVIFISSWRLRDHPSWRAIILRVEHQNRDLRPWPQPPQSTMAAFLHPYDIVDSSSIIEVIGTRDAIDVFHPAPFGIVDILDAFDIRD